MSDVVARAQDAMAARDWEAVRLQLHPYLHWSDAEGRTLRGRSNVMAMLSERDEVPRPLASVEIRDEQIYRWREPAALTSSGQGAPAGPRRARRRPRSQRC